MTFFSFFFFLSFFLFATKGFRGLGMDLETWGQALILRGPESGETSVVKWSDKC
jgi:hypothetical protein